MLESQPASRSRRSRPTRGWHPILLAGRASCRSQGMGLTMLTEAIFATTAPSFTDIISIFSAFATGLRAADASASADRGHRFWWRRFHIRPALVLRFARA